MSQAPEICKACLASLRRWYPDKKIITLDKNNLSQYATLPDYIERKHKQGIIPHAHYSDILRLQLLLEHGGSWIDSTIFFTGRKFEEIMNLPFFIFRWNKNTTGISNWFIVSAPHNPILELVRDLHYAYWRDHDYLTDYFIFHMFFEMAAQTYRDEWDKVPYIYAGIPLSLLDAVKQGELYSEERMKHFEELSGFHKLTYKTIAPRQWESSAIIPVLTEQYRKDFEA